jgi:hypothetical protein
MADDRDQALQALKDASARASLIRLELDAAYLQAIAAVESLPANQTGADKTWVGEAGIAFRRHYQSARRS